jgi:hypothetical protein
MTDTEPQADPFLWWNVGIQAGEIKVRWFNGAEHVLCYWGDDRYEVIGVGAAGTHRYDHVGAYMVRIHKIGPGPLIEYAQVVIRPGRLERVHVGANPDDPATARVGFGELDNAGVMPLYRIWWRWPDQQDFTETWGLPGTHVDRSLPAGKHTIHVADVGSKWWIEREFTSPGENPPFTVTAAGRVATLTVGAGSVGKPLTVSWGDGTLAVPVRGATATHTYPSIVDTTYVVQLWHSDASSYAVHALAIPGGI